MNTVLITGASKGIGRALAIKYAKEGYNLVLIARNENDLITLTNEINEFNIQSIYYLCDVTNKEQIKEIIEDITSKLKIDIAILNAGISHHQNFDNFNTDVLLDTFNTNIFGVMYCMEYLIPYFKVKGKGTIAGVSSLAEARGLPGSSIYCSSKIALSYLLEAARIELKPLGINVLTVKPGFVKTPMTDKNDFSMPLIISAEESADIIFEGIKNKKRVIAFPKAMQFYSYIGKIIPSFIFEPIISKFLPKFKR